MTEINLLQARVPSQTKKQGAENAFSAVRSLRSRDQRNLTCVPNCIENGKMFKFYSFAEMEKENEVLVIKDNDGCKYEKENSLHNHSEHNQPVVGLEGKFHIVTNFIHFRYGHYQSNLSYGYGVLTDDVLHARAMEVVDCIQDNLLHPLIKKVHVLVPERETLNFLKRIDFISGEKMIIQLTDESVTMKQQLIYASNCLKNEIVAIYHQDNKFGQG